MSFRNLVLSLSLFALAFMSPLISEAAPRPVRENASGDVEPASLPSFDCAKAGNESERKVCTNANLGWADRSLGETYLMLLTHTPKAEEAAIQDGQRQWLRRRDACSELDCLLRAYEERNRALRSDLKRRDTILRSAVNSVGACGDARIDAIGARLTVMEGKPLNGTSVGFTNGVRQVSYDREPAIIGSRLGDPVHVCLASIPPHCPPGDDRGRIYDVTNLRTRQRWTLPDAEHSCGGA